MLEVDTSLPGTRVVKVLERLGELRGLPRSITVDHGPELRPDARRVELPALRAACLHPPGQAVENAYVESFNGRLRDECLTSSGS